MSARTLPIPTGPLALLSRLLSKLDLTPTQREDLDRSYNAVTDVLRGSNALKDILVNLELRPQGSIRAGTVVRPWGRNTFDLDFICWMEFVSPGRTPTAVWQLVWEALGEHAVYKEMRQAKPRCVRLGFAKGYDIDITPAVPDATRRELKLWVPDKKLESWSPSNPIGFCDDWLRPISKRLPVLLTSFSAGTVQKSDTVTASNARTERVEELPSDDGFDKAPLLRLIQLAKFLRDEHYPADDKHRPSSILLTTVTALAYQKALTYHHNSLDDFVIAVLGSINDQIRVIPHGDSFRFEVLNPADDRGENFADKWTVETYTRFNDWTSNLVRQATTYIKTKVEGLDGRIRLLNSTIPGAERIKLMDDIGAEMRRRHDSGRLGLIAVPSVASSATSIRRTTFFGNP